jgi:lysophospholipase L1-like esterase
VTRFTTWADKFEVYYGEVYGFRLKVNGEYIHEGVLGNASQDGIAAFVAVSLLVDFGAAAFRRIEIEWDKGPVQFGGIRVPAGYSVEPWHRPDALRISVFGDSIVNTVIDTADPKLAIMGQLPQVVRALTGQPDVWAQGSSNTGFFADSNGTRSDFIERATVDFPFYGPFDAVIEIGGRNDSTLDAASADAFQARVEQWIEIVLANNPDAIICMTGPQSSSGTEAYNTNTNGMAIKQDRKKAAAAKYPRNCLFIETIGNAANPCPWITGNGRVGAAGSTPGSADRLSGDGIHRSIAGHWQIGARIVQEIARRLPALASRIRDGVVAGVNDWDLV